MLAKAVTVDWATMRKLFRIFTFLIVLMVALVWVFIAFAHARTVRLSHDEVKRMMLDQAYSVQQARLRSDAAQTSIMQSKGIFDTNLAAGASHQIDNSKKPSPIFGDRIDTTILELGANRKFPTGTEAGIGIRQERLRYYDALTIGGNPVFPPNAIYEPIIAFSLSQPVMKNMGGYIDRRTVKSAELGSLATELASQREIETLVYGALSDYWNLVIVRRLILSKKKSVEFARQFLSTTQEEFKLGTAEETDVIAARANVLVREDELLSTKEIERAWQEKLRVKLALGPEVHIENVEKKPVFIALQGGVDQRINMALSKRRDYLASKQELEMRDVELAIAKNQRWPSMDLYTTLELNEIKNGLTSAWGSVDSPNWTVGMNFSVPIENRVARAGRKRADIQKASALVALKDLENRITNSVKTSYEEVSARKKIVRTSQRAFDLQREKLRQERKKYSLGRSTSDLIVRFQDDVVASELGYAQAWLAYKNAVLNLYLAEGTLVEFDDIEEENL